MEFVENLFCKCDIKNICTLINNILKFYSSSVNRQRFGRHEAHKRHDTMGEVSYSII